VFTEQEYQDFPEAKLAGINAMRAQFGMKKIIK
jgi:hypothetical protein